MQQDAQDKTTDSYEAGVHGGSRSSQFSILVLISSVTKCSDMVTGKTGLTMEAKLVDPLPLDSLIFIKQFNKIKDISDCFTIVNTLRAWKDSSKKLGITNYTSTFSPMYRNQI